jgi:hypothetical protein
MPDYVIDLNQMRVDRGPIRIDAVVREGPVPFPLMRADYSRLAIMNLTIIVAISGTSDDSCR